MSEAVYDIAVIGSGPGGQKAAVQGAKAGKKVLVIEQENDVGGACVHRGTIPSKTLRETAIALQGFLARSGGVYTLTTPPDLQVVSLMMRMEQVILAHEKFMAEQLARNGIESWNGRARFASPELLEVEDVTGKLRTVRAKMYVIASGSRPRDPENVPVDHEHILDSDSILSMRYLPESLVVLGAGVIASEYASIFATLGVKVTMVDRGARPVPFLDPELTDLFEKSFGLTGGKFLGGRTTKDVRWDGLDTVVTTLDNGAVLRSEKVLFALGRVGNVESLQLEKAGLKPTSRGTIEVDVNCRTAQPHIYAVGDVIGPPSLASASMEQGRRAVCHFLGIPAGRSAELVPLAVYAIPEVSTVGLSEAQATEKFGSCIVGRARFAELARGQIAAVKEGLLKMVADPTGQKLLGVQILGEGAAEIIHVAQLALLNDNGIDTFIDNCFNFPTLAEAYRVAALDVAKRRPKA